MVKKLEAETQENMRDHYNTRVWALRPKCINDTCYSDTSFSGTKSIRGFKCLQMFVFKMSSFESVWLMKREVDAPTAHKDAIREIRASNKIIIDNAQVLTDVCCNNINRNYCISTGLTILHHKHQNYAEGCGNKFKFALLKLFHNTPHTLISYWCYAIKFLDKTRQYWSRSSLGD